jgi:hypothetical protein
MLGEEYKSWTSSLCSFLHSPVTSFLFGPNNPPSTLISFRLTYQNCVWISLQPFHWNRPRHHVCFLIWFIYMRLCSVRIRGAQRT